MAVVGIGSEGNNLLDHVINLGLSPRCCVALNTDMDRLSKCSAPNKVLIGNPTTGFLKRLGENGNDILVDTNRLAPFTHQSDFTILLTGLDEIVDTTAAPAIAQLNLPESHKVVSVVALPFIHERKRRFVAIRTLKRMAEASDCTIVIDNGGRVEEASYPGGEVNETAWVAVRIFSEVLEKGNLIVAQRVLAILRLGRIATLCSSQLDLNEQIQISVLSALRTRFANLLLSQVKGVVIVFHGLGVVSAIQSARAYEAVASLIGHDVDFVQLNLNTAETPRLSVFLSGYSYYHVLSAFADFIEDLYDMEYGIEVAAADIGAPVGLYQMEIS